MTKVGEQGIALSVTLFKLPFKAHDYIRSSTYDQFGQLRTGRPVNLHDTSVISPAHSGQT